MSSDSSQRALTAPAAVMNAPLAVHGFDWEPGSEGYVVTVPTVNLERSLPGPTALLSRLDRSIILQCNDLKAAPSGWVTGVARPVHIGRSTHVWAIEMTNDQGQLTCVSRITMAMMPAR